MSRVDLSSIILREKKKIPLPSPRTREENEIFSFIEELVSREAIYLGSHYIGEGYYELVVVMRDGRKIIFESVRPFPKLSCLNENGNAVFV